MKKHQRAFSFPVELGQVIAFNRATGGTESLDLVPLTYVMAADQFDPEFARRPRAGQPWLEHPIESLFHVEQTIDYYAPLCVGMQLTAVRRQGRRWQKQGRTAGKLEFIETVTELRSDEGELLLSSSWVDIKTERSHVSVTRNQADDRTKLQQRGVSDHIDEIHRTMLVMYVGAAGDFHPLHHDEAYAIQQGYPSVFAPGMLTMALNGRAVTQKVEQEKVRRFSGRFKAQVWPGDRISTELTLSNEGTDTIVATSCNQFGTTVFVGQAVIEGGAIGIL